MTLEKINTSGCDTPGARAHARTRAISRETFVWKLFSLRPFERESAIQVADFKCLALRRAQ